MVILIFRDWNVVKINTLFSTTNRSIFGEVQLKDGCECLATGPGAIALGPMKSTTATLSSVS